MELHDVGPVKFFDTAGIDEGGDLGEKKRRKAYACLKVWDGVLGYFFSLHGRFVGFFFRDRVIFQVQFVIAGFSQSVANKGLFLGSIYTCGGTHC